MRISESDAIIVLAKEIWYYIDNLTNLANVFVKSLFIDFPIFFGEKGRIKLNPQQLWIFEKTI